MPDAVIEVHGLRKAYGEVEAVRHVDLTISAGEVFALLGPNGAGKTTTVEILEGHRQRDAGEVRILGYDPGSNSRALKERIGIVLQETATEPYLTVEETIEMFRGYYPHPRPLDEVIGLVGLEEQRKTRVIRLSGGQQRRLDVAIGLAGDPELLFLDEPTTGFDPVARREAWQMIRGLQSLGKTVFLTTHYMEEAEQLAGRVAIIRGGEIIAEGSPQTLIETDPNSWIRFKLPPDGAYLIEGIEGAVVAGDDVGIETPAPTVVLYALTSRAHDRGIELESLSVTRPTLEDTYLRFLGAAAEADVAPPPASRGRRGRR